MKTQGKIIVSLFENVICKWMAKKSTSKSFLLRIVSKKIHLVTNLWVKRHNRKTFIPENEFGIVTEYFARSSFNFKTIEKENLMNLNGKEKSHHIYWMVLGMSQLKWIFQKKFEIFEQSHFIIKFLLVIIWWRQS